MNDSAARGVPRETVHAVAVVRSFALEGLEPAREGASARPGTSPRRRFEGLLERHEQMLRRVALGVLGDPHRVDDVLQEAFLKAFRKLPARFESERQEAVWLYRVVHRCCLDELRRRRRRPEVALEEAAAPHEPETTVAVLAALATLSPEGRAVVLLVDLIGFDYDAAAEALGIPRGTVASRLSAARGRLREAFDA